MRKKFCKSYDIDYQTWPSLFKEKYEKYKDYLFYLEVKNERGKETKNQAINESTLDKDSIFGSSS